MKIKNLQELCEEITKRESRKGKDVNITQTRSILRHFFEVMGEISTIEKYTILLPCPAINFLIDYVRYYKYGMRPEGYKKTMEILNKATSNNRGKQKREKGGDINHD